MAVAALIAGLLLLPLWSPVKTLAMTAVLVPELMRTSIHPLSDATAEPVRITTMYGEPQDRMDIYLPQGASAGSNLPAVVLELGVHPQPIDSPEIVQIAESISRLGVVVGIPDSSALRELKITPAEPGHLADAVVQLSNRPEVDKTHVGLAGFSAGASMALVAAADPRIADDLRFVSAFGGYADAETLMLDVATNSTVRDGQVVSWQADPGIREDIKTMLLTNPRLTASDAALVEQAFATNDRATAQVAIASFSPDLKAQLEGISPDAVADQIKVPVYLLHGRPDTAIPVEHAQVLGNALGNRLARFTEFGDFGHGRPDESGLGPEDAGDIAGLYLYLRDIVAATLE